MHELNAGTSYQMQGQSTKTNRSEYKKLAGVFAVIVLCATTMSFVLGFDWQEWIRWFIGGYLIIFGSFKLIGYEDFITVFPDNNPLAKKFSYYNYTYPFIELFLGFLYTSNLLPMFRDTATLILLGIGAYGILRQLSNDDSRARCVCVGGVIRLQLNNICLLTTTLIAGLAGIMLVSNFIF